MTMTVMPNMHASVCECICVPVLCVSRYVRVCMPVPGCGVCLALSLACPCGCVCACCERPARPAHSAWGSAQLARAQGSIRGGRLSFPPRFFTGRPDPAPGPVRIVASLSSDQLHPHVTGSHPCKDQGGFSCPQASRWGPRHRKGEASPTKGAVPTPPVASLERTTCQENVYRHFPHRHHPSSSSWGPQA